MAKVATSVIALLAVVATSLALAAPASADPGTDPQTITFPAIDNATVGDAPVALTAEASSGLPVQYSIDPQTSIDQEINEPVCGLGANGTSVVVAHAGVCVVDADQDGNDAAGDPTTYAAAATATRAFVIRKGTQSIDTFTVTPTGAVGDTQLVAVTASSGLDVTLSIDPSSVTAGGAAVCEVLGKLVYFDHVGLCTVLADQPGSSDYTAADTVSQQIQIAQGTQTITFGALPSGVVGAINTLGPTTSSDLTVSLSIDASTDTVGGEPVCSLTGAAVSYDHVGNCVVDANQDGTDGAGNDDYVAADQQQQSVVIGQASQTITFHDAPGAAAIGTTASLPTAASDQLGATPVTVPAQDACSLDASTLTFNHAGPCIIHSDNAGNADYLDSGDQTKTITVNPAATAATVTLHQAKTAPEPTITVNVTALAPAVVASVDGGTVAITVDGQPAGTPTVTNGVATAEYAMAPGTKHIVTAVYTAIENGDFMGSAAPAVHRDPPSITMQLTSARPESKSGWYRTPVTASFQCTAGTAAFGACPANATRSRSGKGQPITGQITADDGGAASASATVNIDMTTPKVIVAGVTDGNTYIGRAPKARCLASDTLSGVRSCQLVRTAHASGVTTFRATATDQAGNTTTVTGRYRVQRFYLREAIYDSSNNSYIVQTGTPYTLVALAYHRPRYYVPTRLGRKLRTGGGNLARTGTQAGIPSWTRTITFSPAMLKRTFWNIGAMAAGTMHRIKIRVVG